MKKKHIIASCVIATAVIAGARTLWPAQAGSKEIYPRAALTPGQINLDITQANLSLTLCNPNWSTKSIRPPASYTTALKIKQLNTGYTYSANGNADLSPTDYEEDHLISLELGGNPTDPNNLWPEPYHTQINGAEVGAKQKDSVENYLHKQICAGTMTLKEAQTKISQDWYAVYKSQTSGALGGLKASADPDDE